MKAARWVWHWVGARPWIAVLVLIAGGQFVSYRALEIEEDARLDRQELDDAQRCVTAWEARSSMRDMAEVGYRRNAATLLSFARDSERATAYEAQVERDVIEIRSALPDPECDLEAAQRRLEEG